MVLLAVYALFLVYAIGRLFWRRSDNDADYIVLGRRLTLPAFVMTLVATWYGGILGVGEYSWRYGLSNWFVFGLPYYVAAALFAWLLAARARRSRALTIPDQLASRYGFGAAMTGAATVFLMTVPAAYVLMLGALFQLATGWPLWVGVVVGTVLSTAYVVRGGFRAIVGTDIVHFVLMFLGFLILVPACVVEHGGWGFLRAQLPAGHWSWDGGRGVQAILVWYFLALSTLVEPAFYLRCYAARTESVARRGVAISIGFWLLFDFLTTTAGLYARAVLPELADPVTAYPALAARTLPPLGQGLFVVGLFATVISTVDDYAFLSAVTVGRDLVQRARARRTGRPLDEGGGAALPWIRWCLAATAAAAVGLALWSRSVVELWHHLGSVGTPTLLLPLALSHSRWRVSGRLATAAMLAAGGTSLAWLAAGRGGPFLDLEPIFPGLLVSVAVLAPGIRRSRRTERTR